MISKRMIELLNKNSAIREMFEEGTRLSKIYGQENVYDFSLGNPIVETPIAVNQNIFKVLNNYPPFLVHGYMPNAGFLGTREQIAQWLNTIHKTKYTSSNIVMCSGAAGGLNCVLQTLLNPRDEVVVIAPFFVEYANYINNWGGKMVIANSNQSNFHLQFELIDRAISKNTKAIIINNPNNPTGVLYDDNSIKNLSLLLSRKAKEYGHPIYLISDEPYRELVYDNLKTPYIPCFYNNTIVVYSWSKSLSLPGERIGYIAVSSTANDAEIISKSVAISNRIIGFVNAPSLFQMVVKECLNEKTDISFYDKNRVFLYKKLTAIGYDVTYPQGAFYLWAKAPCEERKFIEICKKNRLLVVPGSSFYGPGYFRIAYCVKFKQIVDSIPAFEKAYIEATTHEENKND